MGMESKFKDFFPIYEAKSLNKEDRIKKLSQEIGNDYDTWADFESALGKYTLKFTAETKQDFIDQVRDFEEEFVEYLKLQESMLSFNFTKLISDTMINGLTKYYDNLAPDSKSVFTDIYYKYTSDNHTYNFINFNYTQVLEKCLDTILSKIVCKRKFGDSERTDKIGKVIHVHGRCDAIPIIGVNDVGQVQNKELAKDSRFTGYIVKPSLNKLLRLGNDKASVEIINQSKLICVYGMSLGATDKTWWNLILNWLNDNGERQIVIFDYDRKYTTSNQFSWLEKENLYIDKLSSFSNGIDVEKLRSRIHIAVHKNIFEMDLAKQSREMFEQAMNNVLSRSYWLKTKITSSIEMKALFLFYGLIEALFLLICCMI